MEGSRLPWAVALRRITGRRRALVRIRWLLRGIKLQAQHRAVDALDALKRIVHRIELQLHLAEGLDHLGALRSRIGKHPRILLLALLTHADALPEPESPGRSGDEESGGDEAAVVALGLHTSSLTNGGFVRLGGRLMKNPRQLLLLLLFGALVLLAALFLKENISMGSEGELSLMQEKERGKAVANQESSSPDVHPLRENFMREGAIPVEGDLVEASLRKITVLDWNGIPQPGVDLIPWVGQEVLQEITTDSAGQVRVDELRGAGGFAVKPPGFLPQYQHLSFDEDSYVIRLDKGLSYAGQVLFKEPWNGEGAFSMTLYSFHDLEIEGVPKTLLKQHPMKTIPIVPDARGFFSLQGLPSDWRGSMRLPQGVILCSFDGPGTQDSYDLVVDLEPAEQVRLELMPLPFLTARVVTPDGLEGVEGASLMWILAPKGSSDTGPMTSGVSGIDGRVRIPMPISNLKEAHQYCSGGNSFLPGHIQVHLFGVEGFAGTEFHLDLGTREDPWSLGDLPFERTQVLPVRLLDSRRLPVQGALAYGVGLSDPADEDGWTEVVLASKAEQFSASAVGYRIQAVEVPENLEDPLEILLEESNHLTVRFEIPEGVQRKDWSMKLASDGDLFETGWSENDAVRFRHAHGQDWFAGRGGKGRPQHKVYRLPIEEDHIDFWGLKVGQVHRASISDAFGNELVVTPDILLGATEHQEFTLKPDSMPGTFHGMVVDEAGNPIPRVEMMVYGAKGSGRGAPTKADGTFTMKALATDRVIVSLKKEGFAHFRTEVDVPKDGASLRLVMEAERRVTVLPLDEHGVLVQGFQIGQAHDATGFLSESLEDGSLLLTRISKEEMPLVWSVGGLRGSTVLPEDVTEWEIEVPSMGAVVLVVRSLGFEEAGSARLILEPIGEELVDYVAHRGFKLESGITSQTVDFPARLPGRFHASIERWVPGEEKWFWEPALDLGEIEILPNQTTEIVATF